METMPLRGKTAIGDIIIDSDEIIEILIYIS